MIKIILKSDNNLEIITWTILKVENNNKNKSN